MKFLSNFTNSRPISLEEWNSSQLNRSVFDRGRGGGGSHIKLTWVIVILLGIKFEITVRVIPVPFRASSQQKI